MDWQSVMGLNFIIVAMACILLKLITEKYPRAKALSLQFLFCVAVISSYRLLSGKFLLFQNILLFIMVSLVGFINAFGAYCQWRAIAISLSRTSLLYPLSGVIVVALAAIILNEIAFWNFSLTLGIILSFAGIFLFSSSRKDNNGNVSSKEQFREWLLFAAGAVLIFGSVQFMMKIFSFNVPREQFLTYWYIGAFLGSLPLLYFERKNVAKLPMRSLLPIFFLSLAILGSLATLYWAFQLAEASMVMPIYSIGITFLPVLMGWTLFKETKGLSKKGIIALFLAIVGALLIILS